MTDEQERSVRLKAAQKSHALLGKTHIAHAERLVDDQCVGIDMRNNCECQTHIHAAGIGFYRLINELTDVGKINDRLIAFLQLSFRDAVKQPAEIDVLPTRELRVEPRAQLEQRRDASSY